MTREEILTKYRVFVPEIHKTKDHALIFDALDEANDWIEKTGRTDLKAEPVEGTIQRGFQSTGFMTGRSVKVFQPLNETHFTVYGVGLLIAEAVMGKK